RGPPQTAQRARTGGRASALTEKSPAGKNYRGGRGGRGGSGPSVPSVPSVVVLFRCLLGRRPRGDHSDEPAGLAARRRKRPPQRAQRTQRGGRTLFSRLATAGRISREGGREWS